MESMPSPCYVGDAGSLYRQKHNPFIYFDNIRTNAARCGRIVPYSQFTADAQANTLPDYVWITPNMCNDRHDCSVSTGDSPAGAMKAGHAIDGALPEEMRRGCSFRWLPCPTGYPWVGWKGR